MKELIKKYSHIWTALYAVIYMPCFIYLEKTVTSDYHIIHIAADDKIPYIDIFIIPYLLWFFYVGATFVYLFFYNKKEYYKFCVFTFTGMTLFIIISFLYPNGLNLRESITYNDNIFSDMVRKIHTADTCTNVFPSLHVFNSLACMVALAKSKGLENKKWIKVASAILATLIILSTVFLKQHSLIDVAGAFILAAIMYVLVYLVKSE